MSVNPSFIEELFMRIEERLNSLESQIQRMNVEITHLKQEMQKSYECREEIQTGSHPVVIPVNLPVN